MRLLGSRCCIKGSRNTFYPLVDLTSEGDGLLIAWSLEVVWLVRSSNPPPQPFIVRTYPKGSLSSCHISDCCARTLRVQMPINRCCAQANTAPTPPCAYWPNISFPVQRVLIFPWIRVGFPLPYFSGERRALFGAQVWETSAERLNCS